MVDVIFFAHLTSFRLTRKEKLPVSFLCDYMKAECVWPYSASAKEDGEVG